jgi:hypothetical protein
MVQNVHLIGMHYPGWKVYIYVSPDVDSAFLSHISGYSNVVLKHTGKLGGINRIERLFAIDEPDVELMFVRDADSRVHWKDRWAINDFLSKPSFLAHAIRDHKDHNARLLAGLWGIRKSSGVGVRGMFETFLKNPIDLGYGTDGVDQSFLGSYIYPYIKGFLLVHYSNNLGMKGEYVVEFPFYYTDNFHCGKVDGSNFIDGEPVQPRMALIGGRFRL